MLMQHSSYHSNGPQAGLAMALAGGVPKQGNKVALSPRIKYFSESQFLQRTKKTRRTFNFKRMQ